MANQTQNNFGKEKSNWFSRIIEKEGPYFMETGRVTTEKIDANAERILDDFIYGNVDLSKYGYYVIHPVIIGQLIKFCKVKLVRANAIRYALGYLFNDYQNGYINIIGNIPMGYDSNKPIRGSVDSATMNSIVNELDISVDEITKYSKILAALETASMTNNAYEIGNLANDQVLKSIMRKRKY